MQPWNWNHFWYTTFVPSGRTYKRQLKVLHDFTRKDIQERRQAMSAQGAASAKPDDGTEKKPFLDMLLEATDDNGHPLSDAGRAGLECWRREFWDITHAAYNVF